jgi:hypothetical protein
MIEPNYEEKREHMQSISEIKEILSSCSMEELPEQMKQFEEDSRKGVQTALASFRKKYEIFTFKK